MSDEPTPIADILNNPAPAASDPAPSEPVASEPVKEAAEQPRAPDGKFAPKQTPPAVVEKPPGESIATPPVAPSQPSQREVPLQALIDQRLEARQYKQRASELERQLAELQKPKAEPVDYFTDPEAALNQRLQPLQQQLQQTVSTLTLRASKAEAVATHGKKSVDEMEAAIGEAMEAGDPEVHQLRQQMLSSEDPVGVAMSWFQRRRVMSEVGTDPVAYREKLKAEIIAEMQGGQPPAQPAPVMPSNIAGARNVGTRAGPAWSGPKPLEDIFKR